MKPLGLGYQKIIMCPNVFILNYLENAELTRYKACGHACYKPKIDRVMTLIAHKKNLDISKSLLDCKSYLCLQKLLST
jgi:hypothetical protein